MYEITEDQLAELKDLFKSQVDKIKKLQDSVESLTKECDLVHNETRVAESKLDDALFENKNLKEENQRLLKKCNEQEYTMKAILEKLNETLDLVKKKNVFSIKHEKFNIDKLLSIYA
jgi:chromosome segregation ATPase